MRCEEVARGVELPLVPVVLAPLELPAPLEGDDIDPLVLVEPDEAPLVSDVPLDVPVDVPLDDPLVPLAPLDDGLLRFTSPPDVFVVLLPCALPVDGVQFVMLVADASVEPEAPDDEDMPEVEVVPLAVPLVVAPVVPVVALAVPLMLPFDALVVPVADASAVPVVDGVVPVPLAPFVRFRPVNRWSGLVAVLRAESDVVPAAPVDDPVVELELIVDEDE